jgi:CRISPR-associated protein Cmr4
MTAIPSGFHLWIFTESGLHAGGDEAIGSIDEPIQRDTSTRYPVIHGQSLKGAERRRWTTAGAAGSVSQVDAVFGGDVPTGANSTAPAQGWLDVGEARLVAFPIPSLIETFLWVTSPLALARVARDGELTGMAPADKSGAIPLPVLAEPSEACATKTGALGGMRVRVGDFNVDAVKDDDTTRWAKWLSARLPVAHAYMRQRLVSNLIVVADDLLAELTIDFVEVQARVQLKSSSKTVGNGPFYSEFLPTATLLAAWHGLSRAPQPASALQEVTKVFDQAIWTIGGDESVGKGIVTSTVLQPTSAAPA